LPPPGSQGCKVAGIRHKSAMTLKKAGEFMTPTIRSALIPWQETPTRL